MVLKAVVLLCGATLVVAGAAMLVLPGPGVAAVLLGLVVLGSEFAAADRLRARLQGAVRAGWSAAAGRRRRRRRADDASGGVRSEDGPAPGGAGRRPDVRSGSPGC
ncbi:MAG: hypothetical protein GC157_16355 [Frankiales bacterium]|nr:hypothetical protein [Frankiales bacterium]